MYCFKKSALPPFSSSIDVKNGLEQHLTGVRAHNLWLHARKNFYYKDDHSRAASLCKRLISRYPLTEEADEARLLLHDIRIEIRKLAEGSDTGSFGFVREEEFSESGDEALSFDSRLKFSIATAAVAIPIIGIAQGGVIGIIFPQILSMLGLASVFWISSAVGLLLKKGKRKIGMLLS